MKEIIYELVAVASGGLTDGQAARAWRGAETDGNISIVSKVPIYLGS